jgi:cytochrome c oxidase subunit II
MKKKIAFGAGLVLFALALLSTRFYMVDLPLWHILGGGDGPDPATLHLHGEFVESNLGTSEDPKGAFTVRMIAQQYVFVPQCVLVPAGVPVRFRITSADVTHKLSFLGTNYGLEAVPGAVSEATFKFEKTGDFNIPCHEFCGPGHYAMRGLLRVVQQNQFPPLSLEERRACESR